MKSKVLFLMLLCQHFLAKQSAAQLYTFSFGSTNTTTCITDGNNPAAIANASITAFTRTGFPNFTCDSYIGYLNTKGWDQGTAVDYNQYLEVTITAASGYKLNVASISFNISKSSTGPATGRVAHNGTTGFTSTYKDFTPASSAALVNWNDFTSFSTTAGGSVSFRIYGWGATSTVGTMRMGSFAIYGAVTQAQNTVSSGDSVALASTSLREIPFVLRNKDTLALSNAQVSAFIHTADSIKLAAAAFAAQNPGARYNTRSVENDYIQQKLTPAQYLLLLNIKSERWCSGNNKWGGNVFEQPIPFAVCKKDTLGINQEQIDNLLLAYDSIKQAEGDFRAANPGQKYDSYTPQYAVLESALSSTQYDFYREVRYKFNFRSPFTSQFTLALRYKDTLGLSTTQIAAIRLCNDTLKNATADSARLQAAVRFDGRAYESSRLTDILTGSQYILLLTIKNKAKAKVFALNDWNEMQLRNISENFNRDSVMTQLTAFYIVRENSYNRYQHDKIQQTAVIQFLYMNKPPALNALFHARRNPDNNTQGQGFQW